MTVDPALQRNGAFFGRRIGHPLRTQQAALFETLLPRLAVDLAQAPPARLAGLFDHPVEAVRLEIGFGGGEHLLAEAEQHPQAGFIGVEPFVNGMAQALMKIDARAPANVRLHYGDALFLLEWLPDHSIDRLDLLYPDPWRKRKHWKRRFVQDKTIALMARVLRPGGEFRFLTDWADYATWTLSHLMRSEDFEWTAERADDWRLPWPGFTQTRYGAKAKREGRLSSYLIFRRR
jgi:tRNA (guanine-N7-)-methyltransferase